MVRSDAGFECGKYKNFFFGTDLENASAEISDIEITAAVERNAGRNAHAFEIEHSVTRGIDRIDAAVVPARYKQIACKTEGQAGRIHYLGCEGSHRTLGCDLVDRNGSLLPAP